jgi:RNA recognition motif-containing protein
VDIDFKGDKEESLKPNDYEKTIFIGNLPWVVQEEDLRKHFEDCGKILNVRIIRDSVSLIGKGFAYIMFETKEFMKKAIADKNGSLFKKRELRVKKAVEAKRLEKK